MDNYPVDSIVDKNVTSTPTSSNRSPSILLFFISIMILNFISYVILVTLLKKYSSYKNKIKVINYERYLITNPVPPEHNLICSICLDTFDDTYILTKCQHYYHKAWLYEWLNKKIVCPNCKTDLNEL
jgi:hypothetical protein